MKNSTVTTILTMPVLLAGCLTAKEPELIVTHPRNGMTMPAGAKAVYVTGAVKPANATVECNGNAIECYKSGSFLFMQQLQAGTNKLSFTSGKLSKDVNVIVPIPNNTPPTKISLKSFQQPVGVMPGSEVTFSCTAPAGKTVTATIGDIKVQLSASAASPTSYSAKKKFDAPLKATPVVFAAEGLDPITGKTLKVANDWPLYKFTGKCFETRARSIPGDGDTVCFPVPGLVFKTKGYENGYIRCDVSGTDAWIVSSAMKEVTNGNPITKLPDLSAGIAERPSKEKKRKDILIMLDPGHGGSDTGALSPAGKCEKEANLLQAKAIAKQLRKAGFKVKLTREKDVAVGLYERVEMAIKAKADAFISVHHNATAAHTDPMQVRHYISFFWNDRGKALAESIHPFAAKTAAIEDRGVRNASFAVCRNPAVPSCLLEFDFINCPVGEDVIFNDTKRREQFAKDIVSGIIKWISEE